MTVTKVETRVVMLKLMYGMEIGEKVDQLIRKLLPETITGDEDRTMTSDEEQHKELAQQDPCTTLTTFLSASPRLLCSCWTSSR